MRNIQTDELKQFIFELNIDLTRPLYLVAFGCVHKGSPNHAEHDWAKFCEHYSEFRKHNQVKFIGMGDYIEYFSKKERVALSNPDIHESTIDLLDRQGIEIAESVHNDISFMGKDLLGLIEGNHRWDFSDGSTSTMYLCRKMGCLYLAAGWYGKIKLTEKTKNRDVTRHTIDVYAAHGSGNALTISGSINKMQRFAGAVDANIYLLGHDHQHITADVPKIFLGYSRDGKTARSVEYKRCVQRTGSFYRVFVEKTKSYAVDRLYPPTGLGNAEIEIRFTRVGGDNERYFTLNPMLRSW